MASVDLSQDQWVVLGHVAHSESAWIVRALSRELGVIAVWTPVGRKGKRKAGSFYPLARLEAHGVTRRGSEGLHRFAEVRRAASGDAIRSDVRRSAVAFFLAEVVWRTLPEEHPHPEVAALLWEFAAELEVTPNPHLIHLHFLAALIREMGLAPESAPPSAQHGFSLATGEWAPHLLEDEDHWGPVTAAAFAHLLAEVGQDQTPAPISAQVRRRLVPGMVRYIQHHLAGPRKIKSLEVLEAIFS